MKTTVKWADGAMFVGESGSGHSVVMDGPDDLGGRNLGPRPMEMLLLGTGGCATYDVLSMLKKSRQKVVDCRVELEAERADAVPAVAIPPDPTPALRALDSAIKNHALTRIVGLTRPSTAFLVEQLVTSRGFS